MKLICDSRERKNAHILAWFDKHGIEYEVRKLDIADYMIEGGKTVIDRKQNLSEVCHNLMLASDKRRFMDEIRRGKEAGIDFILLIEHGGNVRCIEDVKNWKNKYSRVPPVVLMNALHKLSVQYNVRVEFCRKSQTAKRIVELLEGENGTT